jgi:hypothetical protein
MKVILVKKVYVGERGFSRCCCCCSLPASSLYSPVPKPKKSNPPDAIATILPFLNERVQKEAKGQYSENK